MIFKLFEASTSQSIRSEPVVMTCKCHRQVFTVLDARSKRRILLQCRPGISTVHQSVIVKWLAARQSQTIPLNADGKAVSGLGFNGWCICSFLSGDSWDNAKANCITDAQCKKTAPLSREWGKEKQIVLCEDLYFYHLLFSIV